jgi:heptosyltransferase II
MKICIELPTWLGDTIMTTPAIENLINFFSESEITLVGTSNSVETLKNHPRVNKIFVLKKNYFYIYKTLKNFDKFDIFISFRGSFRSKIIKFFISATRKFQYDKNKYVKGHQVEKYNSFINQSLQINSRPSNLILHSFTQKKKVTSRLLGINPGASYGSSKRWYPKEFANVASQLSKNYDIVIFGGKAEINIAKDIENYLIQNGVFNYKNLAGKTTLSELIEQISYLDLFVTGDSGPMHIAGGLQIPTVSIFGPTIAEQTSQWRNHNSIILRKNLPCQPCMKRTCHLKHHDCMKLITSSDALKAIDELNIKNVD